MWHNLCTLVTSHVKIGRAFVHVGSFKIINFLNGKKIVQFSFFLLFCQISNTILSFSYYLFLTDADFLRESKHFEVFVMKKWKCICLLSCHQKDEVFEKLYTFLRQARSQGTYSLIDKQNCYLSSKIHTWRRKSGVSCLYKEASAKNHTNDS